MKTIWKYELPAEAVSTVDLPEGGKVLSAGNQGDSIMVWALVDPSRPALPRRFRVFGTGRSATASEGLRFIGTVFMGALVFHVFEEVQNGQ